MIGTKWRHKITGIQTVIIHIDIHGELRLGDGSLIAMDTLQLEWEQVL